MGNEKDELNEIKERLIKLVTSGKQNEVIDLLTQVIGVSLGLALRDSILESLDGIKNSLNSDLTN